MYCERVAMRKAGGAGRAARRAPAPVERAVRLAVRERGPFVVAVSGGRDSMVLLAALARAAPESIACVASFDHGTGDASSHALEFVRAEAKRLGLPIRTARSHSPATRESGWREQRWAFLRGVAHDVHAPIMTAHTLDDHLETVVMRVLRGSHARGLAGLLAPSGIARPLVGIARDAVAATARAWDVRWIDDPTNLSRRHLRNRVRLDILPALERADPALRMALLALSLRAARLRLELDALIADHIEAEPAPGGASVALRSLARFDASSLALLWPALAATWGIILDRRGTERLLSFTIRGRSGARIQVSGGVEAVRHRDRLLLRRVPTPDGGARLTLCDGARWGDWIFRRDATVEDRWAASLDADVAYSVRAWEAGDRLIPEGAEAPRRLKGLFRDAGVDAAARRHWPVVAAGDEVVWVPGVRRARAATDRSGRPKVIYRCEHIDR